MSCDSLEDEPFIGVDLAGQLHCCGRIRSHAVHPGVYFEVHGIWSRIFALRDLGDCADEIAPVDRWCQRPLNHGVDLFHGWFGENEDRQVDATFSEPNTFGDERNGEPCGTPGHRSVGSRRCRHGHTRRPSRQHTRPQVR